MSQHVMPLNVTLVYFHPIHPFAELMHSYDRGIGKNDKTTRRLYEDNGGVDLRTIVLESAYENK